MYISTKFNFKCPKCGAHNKNVSTKSALPTLYTTAPIVCDKCGAKFDTHIANKLGLWLFITFIFFGVHFSEHITSAVGEDIYLSGLITLLASFFIAIIIGAIKEKIKPWCYVPWNDSISRTKRNIVNYGAILSFVAYAIIWYLSRP